MKNYRMENANQLVAENETQAAESAARPVTRAGLQTPGVPVIPIIRLPLSPRVPLVKLDTVVAARGEYPYTIHAHVEAGTLRWVFNLATRPGSTSRDLRFWSREISAFAAGQFAEHAALRRAGIEEVLDAILGCREEFHTGETCLLLGVRRPTLKLLRKELGRSSGELFRRDVLEQFLKRRLVG